MTDQQNSESNQEYNHVPEGAVQPPMVGEEQNPQNNKDKEAYVWTAPHKLDRKNLTFGVFYYEIDI